MSNCSRAEWIKLRTIRRTPGPCSLSRASPCSSAFNLGVRDHGRQPRRPGDNDIVLDSLSGIWFGQVALAVLAILAITSETRMIRTTFAAEPRRPAVLAGKGRGVGAVVLIAGLATSAACFPRPVDPPRERSTCENGYPASTLTDGYALRAVVASGVYLALLAVFSPRRSDPAAHGGRDHARARALARPRDRDQLPAGERCGVVRSSRSWVRGSPGSRPSCATTRSRSARGRGSASSPRTPPLRSGWPSGRSGPATPDASRASRWIRSPPMILAIDAGTTGVTCLVVDDELRTLGRGYREIRQFFPQPGWVEHDPDDIWQTARCGRGRPHAGAAHRNRPGGIGITNQRDDARLGAGQRDAVAARDRLAGPAHG